MTVEFSDDQVEAKRLVDAFLRDPNPPKPWLSVQGEAGTGKSFLLGQVARENPGALLVAYMNKSAHVLSMKSGLKATTIHAAVLKFREETVDEFGDKDLRFDRFVRDGAWRRKIALLDESGTVDVSLAQHLLATGCRVVAMGDPGQLRPVRGERFFERADFSLTRIHRQAWNSPIIRQAHSVRRTGTYAPDGENFRVQAHVGHDDIVAADVILCWRNATRQRLNVLKRAHLGIGDARQTPVAGEPLMALTTDRRMGILNGATYALDEDVEDRGHDGMSLRLTNERGHVVGVDGAWIEGFNETTKGMDLGDGMGHAMGFALAYAATTHKYLGSEEKRIIVVDEYDRAEERSAWCYTSFTRASEAVLVQRSW